MEKKFLLSQNIEVEEQNKTLSIQKKEIDQAFDLIEKKNKNLTDSITYAHHIQKSFLPTIKSMHDVFDQNFVIYQPKDIVSGDFYLVHETKVHQFVVVCDCTGHGVPGAFMTLLGNMLLDNALKKEKQTIPHEILNYLDCRIKELLGNRNYLNSEGMDIAICVINKEEKKLSFAGARSPLLIKQNEVWQIIKGTKRSIGEKTLGKMANRPFVSHNFLLKDRTRFFLWTDGFQDQFGGIFNKKIGSKRLQSIIKMNDHENMEQLGLILGEELKSWREQSKMVYEQTDDILVMGIELNFDHIMSKKEININNFCC